MRRTRLFVVIGTRPEAVKLAPVVRAARRRSDAFETIVCLSGQHRELVASLVDYFDLRPDVDLQVMAPNQNLAELTARCLRKTDDALAQYEPDVVVVQGDTTTAAAAALAGFYRRLDVCHVEAGLRTGDLRSPFPEEFNRRTIASAAALHCAPTSRAADNLRREGIADARIVVTGNTGVDALLETVERERASCGDPRSATNASPSVLVTAHRRESFGRGLAEVCRAVRTLAGRFPNHAFVWPVHLNPQVFDPVRAALGDVANVRLVPPLDYPAFVRAMDRASLILTDSGGIQEEAPSLGKPLLVLRNDTERPEGVEAGCAELVGTDEARIVARAAFHLDAILRGETRRMPPNPYGDGAAAPRVLDAIHTLRAERRNAGQDGP